MASGMQVFSVGIPGLRFRAFGIEDLLAEKFGDVR